MAETTRRQVNRAEAQLAVYAAGRALGIAIDVDQLRAIAELTHTIDDVNTVVDRLVSAKRANPGSPDVRAVVRALQAAQQG